MNGWRESQIGDEIELAYGKSLPAHARETGDFKVYGSNGCIGSHSALLVSGPGIVVGRKGSVGKVVYSQDDFWPIDTTYYVVNKNTHNWRFLYHLLSCIGLDELNSHSAIPGLNREIAYSISISLPDKTEQERIASVLDFVERGARQEALAIKQTQELKSAAMRTLFTCGLRGEAQKETEIGPVPTSWVLTPCDQIFRLTSGKKRPSNLSEHPNDEKPFPVLGGNGVMGFTDEWYLDVPQVLIIGRVGEYCGAVHIASGKVWVTDNALYAKEWLNQNADIAFVGAFFEYYDLNRFKRMAGQPLVTQGMINKHRVTLPPIEVQREIVSTLDAIDRKIDLHRRKLAVLDDLFKALLHKLMTGEIQVGDLDLSRIEERDTATTQVSE